MMAISSTFSFGDFHFLHLLLLPHLLYPLYLLLSPEGDYVQSERISVKHSRVISTKLSPDCNALRLN
jgi:hypothetical protein